MSNVQGESRRGGRLDLQTGSAGFRERSDLRQSDSPFLPVHRGGDEKVDVERITQRPIRSSAEIDRVAVLGMVLDAGACAAPKGIKGRAEKFEVTGPGGLKVSHHPGVRVLGSENGVAKGSFVVVAVHGRRIPGKKHPGEAKHIIAATGLHGLGGGEMAGEVADREKMFVVAVAAGSKGTRAGDGLPKEFGRRVVLRLARQLI